MTEENKNSIPASPETQSAEVREELDQETVTHQGERLQPSKDHTDSEKHMGALEDNVSPVTPPMEGPGDLVSENSEESDQTSISPGTELTPG